MKRSLVITLNLLTWTLLAVYLSFSLRYTSQRKKEQLCREVRVTVLDSAERNFITPAMVRAWFAAEKMKLVGTELSSINTLELERFVRRRGFVRTARVYTSMDGRLNVELTQRRPVVRFNTQNGYNFYVTDDGYVLPQQRYFVVYVPVVTGYVPFPFKPDYVGPLDRFAGNPEKKVQKNYSFLVKLINFVKFVDSDDFWKAFIVQVHVVGSQAGDGYDPDIEIVPRAGDQMIMLGSVDGYEQKLAKLLSFYRHAVAYEGWNCCSYINLKYKDQIVCIE